jgi:DNA invertase Pin-like site-specific DNA recombinase
LIRDRVRSGLAAARAKSKRIGRPPVHVDVSLIRALRAEGCSWTAIAAQAGIGAGTARRSLGLTLS